MTTHHTPHDQRLKVKLTCQAQTAETGITLPAGTVGWVLDYQRSKTGPFWVIDFGLLRVVTLPVNSPMVEIIRGGK